jgi:hypothetical protein
MLSRLSHTLFRRSCLYKTLELNRFARHKNTIGLNEAIVRTSRTIFSSSFAASSPLLNALSLRALSSPASPGGKQTEDNDSSGPSRSTLLMIALGACAVGAYVNIRNYRESEDAATVTVGKSIGKPVLGGPFRLVDHNKKVSRIEAVIAVSYDVDFVVLFF